ncbi:MAG: biotin transporter BioY, partial [Pirellulaceae bacterium]
CGPRSALLAAVGYLSLGLFQLPVFHGGGGSSYLLDPGFGYLAGFLPAHQLLAEPPQPFPAFTDPGTVEPSQAGGADAAPTCLR